MEITGKDIEEFADTAREPDLRKYALITAQILNKTQLKALQPYFARPIVFDVSKGKVAPQANRIVPSAPMEDADEQEGDVSETDGQLDDEEEDDVEALLEEAKQQIAPPTQPQRPAPPQDFGFGDMPKRGRPISPQQAEKEFEEIVRRRQAKPQ